MDSLIQYNDAVNAIKTAILQGQYEAAKGVNRIQLALYYAIGKYFHNILAKEYGARERWQLSANSFARIYQVFEDSRKLK